MGYYEIGGGIYWGPSWKIKPLEGDGGGFGCGSGACWSAGGMHVDKSSTDTLRLEIELNMIKKASKQNLLPLVQIDSLEFEESKELLTLLLKQG